MGLSQADMVARKKAGFGVWCSVIFVLVLAVLLGLSDDSGREVLRYDRAAIASGEVWRLLSGHFVHLGWSHLALNGVGLALIAYLVAACFGVYQWIGIMVVVITAIDLGFWFLEPQLSWYVGLSGLLHGLLAAGTIDGIRCRQREFWIIGVFLVGKLSYELLVGPMPGSEASTGGNVVVAAHLYGAIGGALIGLWFSVRQSRAVPI
jgi:rhomboid family GlyGly-CTERM serine protease